jgi:hypothetical protein
MTRFAIILLLLLGCSVAPLTAAAQQHNKKHPHKRIKPPVIDRGAVATTPPQAQPEPPPTPEHGPSSPPEVTFKGGQLTITARNSTLGDVLNAVKQKTGAAVEMPPASSERVVGQFGPGAPRDVMAQLLNGSHYDYVLLGSPSDPGALNKVVLMARASGPEPAPPQGQPVAPGNQPGLQMVPQVQTDQPEDNAGEIPPEIQQPEEEQPEQPEQTEQPDQPPPDQAQPGQNGPVVKTPEQLLRELQQQQQQQQQNGQTPPQ